MKVIQIRPAIYGTEIRYELYEKFTSNSFWSGCKTSFHQLYFEKEPSGWVEIDYVGWKLCSKSKCRRSFKTLKEVDVVLKEAFGNGYENTVWRPEL